MNLKDLRKNKGFSQRKVSGLTGLNITHLGILEKGKEEKINEALEYEEDNNSDMCTFIETLEDEDFDVTCEDETSSIGFEYEVV